MLPMLLQGACSKYYRISKCTIAGMILQSILQDRAASDWVMVPSSGVASLLDSPSMYHNGYDGVYKYWYLVIERCKM